MILKEVEVMGMPLTEWKHESCTAHIGVGDDWATIYNIESRHKNKGHATKLIKTMRRFYEGRHKKFGSSVAVNPAMKHILEKLKINEYHDQVF